MPTQPPTVGDSTNLLLKKLVTATEGISGGGGGAVNSVNGQTGTVVLTAASVGAAHSFPIVSAAQTVYVSKGGVDGAGRGTPDKPFLTVQAGLSAISDSSLTKPYNLMVGPGVYSGAISVPAFVNIQGSGGSGFYATGGFLYTSLVSITVFNGNVTCAAGYNVISDVCFDGTVAVAGGIDGDSVTTLLCCGTSYNSLLAPRATSGVLNVVDSVGASLGYTEGTVNVVGGFGVFQNINNGTLTIHGFHSRLVLLLGAGTTTVTQSSFPSVQVSGTATLNIGVDCFPAGQLSITGGTPTISYINNLVQTQIVHVSKGGNDALADGSLQFPFLTVKAAVDSIVDSGPTKAYVVTIGPGEYEETDFTLPDNVTLEATTSYGALTDTASTVIKSASAPLVIDLPIVNGGKHRIRGIGLPSASFTGGSGVLQSLTIEECSTGIVLYGPTINKVWVMGGQTQQSQFFGVDSSCFFVRGDLYIPNDAAVVNFANLEIYHCYGGYTFYAFAGKTIFVQMRRCFTYALNAGGDGLTLDLDKGSSDSAVNIISGTPTIDYKKIIFYPANSAYWSGDPFTLEEAVNRIASVVGNVVPIP